MKSWLLTCFIILTLGDLLLAATVPTNITSNTVLDTAGSPWIVSSSVTVQPGATLTIDSGVVVLFNSSRQLNVQGNLIANHATFSHNSATPSVGAWNEIGVSGSAQLTNCTIEYADYGVRLFTGGQLTCTNTLFTLNDYPVRISGSGTFNMTDCDYIDNDHIAYYHTYSNVIADHTMQKADLPYFLPNGLEVSPSAHLTIEAGAQLKLEVDDVIINGRLTAAGTAADSIYFTSVNDDNVGGDMNNDGNGSAPAPQDWGGVIFNAGSNSNSILDYCVVKFGGRSSVWGGIRAVDASPTITRSTLAFNYYGIYLLGTSAPTVTLCDFVGSSRVPLGMQLSANPIFVPGQENSFSFSSNAYDAIGILGGTVSTNQTLPQRDITGIQNVTYVVLGDLTIASSATVTIEAGVVIKPLDGKHIYVDGALIVDGSSAEPVIFTSIDDDNHGRPGDTNRNGNTTTPQPSDWEGIVFRQNSSNSSAIRHAQISYAGTFYLYSNEPGRPDYYTLRSGIAIERSSPTIEDVRITNCTYGITCYEDAAPTISNVEIVNATGTPIAVSADADPIISGVTMVNPGLEALGLIANDVFFDGTISQQTIGGYTNITYVLVGTALDIRPDANITVDPGVVIKVLGTSDRIIVNGGLKLEGTAASPVIFTSTRDDQVGNPNDTNGDGNLSSPGRSDWDGIVYTSTANDAFNILNHFVIKFADYNRSPSIARSGLTFLGAGGTVTNGLIQDCYRGVGFSNGATTVVTNTTIQNTTEDALAMTLESNPTFSSLSFVNAGFNSIGILGTGISQDISLSPRDVAGFNPIAYRQTSLDYIINETARLTIQPGVVWKMRNPSVDYADLTVRGGLRAVGTPSQPIIFTDQEDDSAGGDSNADGSSSTPSRGSWQGIFFMPSSDDAFNNLTHVEARYGGRNLGGYDDGAIINFKDAGGTVDQCEISFSSENGIGIFGSADPVISNSTIQNVNYAPIKLSMFSDPSFIGNSVTNVGWIGLDVYPETYTQDATVPQRDFAGYTNITYTVISPSAVGAGVTLTIPAGTVYKSCWSSSSNVGDILYVDGNLQSLGTAADPVVFTHMDDDRYGVPMDTRENGAVSVPTLTFMDCLTFSNQSDDNSLLQHTIFGPSDRGVVLSSASPTFDHCQFDQNQEAGLDLFGDASPVLTDCSFDDNWYVPIMTSLTTYPAITTNNSLSGSTWRGIGVRQETLTADYTLPKRDFAGVAAIPYVFDGNYTVGTSAVLTIEPGVVCKFFNTTNGYNFNVQNGLIAEGGAAPGESIVFTSVHDDFYGGDTDADGDNGWQGGNDSWEGINFAGTSIDADCRLNHVVIRGADRAVECTNASPTILNSRFRFNQVGVYSAGSSNPFIDSCDFSLISSFGVQNTNPSITIKAEHSFWGECSGPTHSTNPTGTGVAVTDAVDFDPWSCTAQTPRAGDVSRNGIVQAFDAALILQHLANVITLDAEQLIIGDVSAAAGLSAFDASLILQYIVGAIDVFPVESTERNVRDYTPSDMRLMIDDAVADAGDEIELPVYISDVADVYAIDATLALDPSQLELVEVRFADEIGENRLTQSSQEGDAIRLMVAGAEAISGDQLLATLVVKVKDDALSGASELTALAVQANETDLTDLAQDGLVRIQGVSSVGSTERGDLRAYPNPFKDVLYIDLPSTMQSGRVSVRLTDQAGRTIHTSTHQGAPTLQVSTSSEWPTGYYVLELKSEQDVHVIPVLYVR